MGKAGLDDEAEAYGETRGHSARQPVFLNLQGLCADSPKRTGVAHPEGSLGSEPQRVGGVDLWWHLQGFPSKVFLAQLNAQRLGSIIKR